MRAFRAFFKKELTEQIRSFRGIILVGILFVFGMMSPILAKMMPDILSQMPMNGLTITLPEPTGLDAWAQFTKNVGQMGYLVLLLLFGGMLSQEISRGTLLLPLSKGISRAAVIVAKFVAGTFLWTVSFGISAAVAYGYTAYLFPSYSSDFLLQALGLMWLFGVFLLALVLFAGSFVPGTFGGLLVAAGIIGILLAGSVFPSFADWNPISLATLSDGILAGTVDAGDLAPAIGMTTGLIAGMVLGAIACFRKRRI